MTVDTMPAEAPPANVDTPDVSVSSVKKSPAKKASGNKTKTLELTLTVTGTADGEWRAELKRGTTYLARNLAVVAVAVSRAARDCTKTSPPRSTRSSKKRAPSRPPKSPPLKPNWKPPARLSPISTRIPEATAGDRSGFYRQRAHRRTQDRPQLKVLHTFAESVRFFLFRRMASDFVDGDSGPPQLLSACQSRCVSS
jgi:hypothetical protein